MKSRISQWRVNDRVAERLLLLSGVLLVAAFGLWIIKARSLDRDINFGLSIPSSALVFDTAIAQSAFEWTLPVSNLGAERVRVLEFESSCGCTKVEPTSCELQPGDSLDLRVTLDLTFAKGEQGSLAEVPFDVTMVPRMLVNQQEIRGIGWRLAGRVRPLIAATPRATTFGGSDAVIGSREQEMVAAIRAADDVGDVLIDSHSTDLFEASIVRHDEPNKYSLHIRPLSSLPVGEFEGEVLLRARFLDGTLAPAIHYVVKGEKLSEIEVTPPIVNFGRRLVGDRATKRVLVRSRIGREIEQVRVSHLDGLLVSADGESPGSRGQLLVFEQGFLAAQTFQAHVELDVRFKDGEIVHAEVPVVAYVAEKQ